MKVDLLIVKMVFFLLETKLKALDHVENQTKVIKIGLLRRVTVRIVD